MVRGIPKSARQRSCCGLEIPSTGGDTLFASMYAAYEALPEPLRQRISGLQAEYAYGGRERRGIDLLEPADQGLAACPLRSGSRAS